MNRPIVVRELVSRRGVFAKVVRWMCVQLLPLLPLGYVGRIRGILDCQANRGARSEPKRQRELLVDVSIIVKNDAGTGIQRAVKALLVELIKSPPAGFLIRPVAATRSSKYEYADAYLGKLIGAPKRADPVAAAAPGSYGDVFLGLDLASRIVSARRHELARMRITGVQLAFVVYDLLPLSHPEWFTPRARKDFRNWFKTIAAFGDALYCISNSVREEVEVTLANSLHLHDSCPILSHFHLGSDFLRSTSVRTIPRVIPRKGIGHMHTILMVGTIEPRKGHFQALNAFTRLWQEGIDVKLVIAGRQGWRMEAFFEKLLQHPEYERRVVWKSNVDDVELFELYNQASGLLFASEGEGFGLPIIEASQFNIPILARDLPVLREVAGESVAYFSATSPDDLAFAIRSWLQAIGEGRAPVSGNMRRLDWRASARQLGVLLERQAA